MRITVPIMTPVILVVTLVGTMASLQSFEIEQVLGAPTRLFVFSTMIYNTAEIERARKKAQAVPWLIPATQTLNSAKEQFQAREFSEARELYERIAAIPLKTDEVELARKRLEEIARRVKTP